MTKYPLHLQQLITYMKKFPGVGSKTAERFAFHALGWSENDLQHFSSLINELKKTITSCQDCLCLMNQDRCPFCTDTMRDRTQLCIITSPKDAYALEETRSFKGLYHVLGGLLSPIDGKTVEHLQLDKLKKRIETFPIKEIIIALDSTLEGDTTSLFLKDHLAKWGLNVSRLAFGLPLGSSLEFVDGGTLARAFIGRQTF